MTLGVYGLTEVLHGYGFIAVFVAALTLRSVESKHEFHGELHDFIGELEHILTWGVLLLLGASVTAGLLEPLTFSGVAIGVLLVFVVRPLVGWLSLARSELSRSERWATAAFGVRGVSSVFYLAVAGVHFSDELPWLWATLGFTVILSVVVHGIAATPVMRFLERRTRRPG
jgi:NhaP-type Na+/H+ or K+/H+ antiporter